MLQILHHYCIKQHRKKQKTHSLLNKMLRFYLLTAFCASFALFNGRVFPFPEPSTLRIYLGFSISTLKQRQDITTELARSHTSCSINIEKILNRPITKLYNGDGVNVITAELGFTKTRPFYNYRRSIILRTTPCS